MTSCGLSTCPSPQWRQKQANCRARSGRPWSALILTAAGTSPCERGNRVCFDCSACEPTRPSAPGPRGSVGPPRLEEKRQVTKVSTWSTHTRSTEDEQYQYLHSRAEEPCRPPESRTSCLTQHCCVKCVIRLTLSRRRHVIGSHSDPVIVDRFFVALITVNVNNDKTLMLKQHVTLSCVELIYETKM